MLSEARLGVQMPVCAHEEARVELARNRERALAVVVACVHASARLDERQRAAQPLVLSRPQGRKVQRRPAVRSGDGEGALVAPIDMVGVGTSL